LLQIIQYQKTGDMLIEELPMPRLKEGGILVQNYFSLISAGTERNSVQTAQASVIGKVKSRPDLVKQVLDNVKKQGLISTYRKVQTRLDNYKKLGYSSAGVVVESSTDEFKIGDRVACAGYASHAEYVFIPKNLAVKIPDNVSFEDAACATLCSIALQGVRQAEPRIGENVAVIGLGLVGLITIQILVANGCRVIGTDISGRNLQLAKDLGCADCILSDSTAASRIVNFTKGYGTDAVIITAATKSNAPLELALEIARKKSKIVVIGDVKMNIPRAPFYEKELDIRNSCSYGPGRYDPNYELKGNDYPIGYVRWTEKRNMEACLALMAQSKIKMQKLITHKFPIQNSLEAYNLILGKSNEPYLAILIEYPQNGKGAKSKEYKIELESSNERLISGDLIAGFIGAGNFAQSLLIPPLSKLKIPLRGLATSTPVNAKTIGNKFKFGFCTTKPEDIFSDPEINTVFIATRHDTHAKYVIESLINNKNTYVEKPLAISSKELAEIEKIYQQKLSEGMNPFLMVGYNRRFSSAIKEIKNFFKERRETLLINYRINAGFIPLSHWYQDEKQKGRIIGEVCHFVDTMQFILGEKPIRVFTSLIKDVGNKYNNDNVLLIINFWIV